MPHRNRRAARWRLLFALLLAAVAGVPAAGGVASAAGLPSYLTQEASFGSGAVTNGWERVERSLDTTAGFHAEDYPPDGRGDQAGQRVTYFGGVSRPYSGRFLLYSAPGWDTGTRTTPVPTSVAAQVSAWLS
ncbi:hypothetical protein ABZ553_07750 [Streptomyces sparsogenes]|uniref:hypothetical protein n=1 Tax=Streptomyces sparsogenes TaxID=67365 RepID=UPI0033F33A50